MNDNDEIRITVGDLRRAAAECPEAQRVLAKLKPEAFGVEHKFRIGDRVTCHCPGQGMDGLSGTVRGYGPRSGLPGVQFDRAFAVGHDLDGRCLPGYGWYCHESSLVPEEQWGVHSVTGGFHPDCPLPRLGDIPEVRALVKAAREYLVCHTTIFEDALTEALEAFDNGDKGEEPR